MKKIAIDLMGGDLGLGATVPGLERYLRSFDSDIVFRLFGDASKIPSSALSQKSFDGRIEIVDTGSNVVSGVEKPSHVLRTGRGTSMFEAINSVANGESDAVVSSGNTGAYMALCKVLIGTIEEIERPAIVSILPNISGRTVMLDLGANTDCSSKKLVQFAIMGNAVAQILLNIRDPRIGLLNIGTEKTKGKDSLEKAYDVLSNMNDLSFSGFVEGTDITNGSVDVVVTDGFSGNISLKTMEGTLKYMVHSLRQGFSHSLLGKLGYILCRGALGSLKKAIDPRNHNGAPLVGLKKVAIKSHGNSDALGFSNAIKVAVNLVNSNFISNIEKMVLESEKETSDEIKDQ